LESELFGHRKGAFTGAIHDKKGLFQEADGGTLFLDEIGSMPALLQSRLLRVLQDHEVRRVGDNTPIYVNVRVLAATNAPLEQRIKDGSFREDLYYRLNVIPLHLPSLRERREDIPLMVAHFLKNKVNPRSGEVFQVTRQVMETLCAYSWPGNVRELENAIERACVLCEGTIIQVSDLPVALQACASQNKTTPASGIFDSPSSEPRLDFPKALYPLHAAANPKVNSTANANTFTPLEPLRNFLREQELAYLQRALAQTGGDKEKAAELLGISLATLYRKLAGDEPG
jgi:DNA-binding NtrC family response regulator